MSLIVNAPEMITNMSIPIIPYVHHGFWGPLDFGNVSPKTVSTLMGFTVKVQARVGSGLAQILT